MTEQNRKIITTTEDKTSIVTKLTSSIEKLKTLLGEYETTMGGEDIATITNPRHTLRFLNSVNAATAMLMAATPVPVIVAPWSGAAHDHYSFTIRKVLRQIVETMKTKGVCPPPPAPFTDWTDVYMYMPEYIIESMMLGVFAIWPGARDLKESITFERNRVMYNDPTKPGRPQLFDKYDREIPLLPDEEPVKVPVGKQEEPALA